jgi:hypothetical protein
VKKPIVIDLYAGLGGWAEGFLAEGYEVIGYDIEAHDYGTGGYPGTLIIRDVRSIHGSELKDAAVIVGSSPCQEFSYRAMPWKRAKALPPPYLGMELFNAQFRIQREASEAAGHHIPMVVENVRGAQKWVGRAQWHYGSFYLWGDVPALMPMTVPRRKTPVGSWDPTRKNYNSDHNWERDESIKNEGGSWFAIGGPGQLVTGANPDGRLDHLKWGDCNGKRFDERPKGNIAAHREGTKNDGSGREGIKQAGISGVSDNGKGDKWFQDGAARHGSRSNSRKAASAMIAKIPFQLALHIAQSFKPRGEL